MEGRSSSVSPTTSWPGMNGIEIIGDRYGGAAPVSSATSDPQMPDNNGATRVQPGPGSLGAWRFTSLSGDKPPATTPAIRSPVFIAVRPRAAR